MRGQILYVIGYGITRAVLALMAIIHPGHRNWASIVRMVPWARPLSLSERFPRQLDFQWYRRPFRSGTIEAAERFRLRMMGRQE